MHRFFIAINEHERSYNIISNTQSTITARVLHIVEHQATKLDLYLSNQRLRPWEE